MAKQEDKTQKGEGQRRSDRAALEHSWSGWLWLPYPDRRAEGQGEEDLPPSWAGPVPGSVAWRFAGTGGTVQNLAESFQLLLDLAGPFFDQAGKLNSRARRSLIHFQEQEIRGEPNLGAGLAKLLQEHLRLRSELRQAGRGGKDPVRLRVSGCHLDLVLPIPG